MKDIEYIPPKVQTPLGERKILLHTCCAPCSSAILECLIHNGLQPTIYYYNPNIHPFDEYEKRMVECRRYAEKLGVEMIEEKYDHEEWLECVQGLENAPERGPRCLECFKMRLLKAAEYASAHDFKVLTTTLASSRWKSLEQINEAGKWAVNQVEGVVWWDQNWRKEGLQPRRGEIIKEMNFYNQLYCGCEYSRNNI